MTAFSFTKLTTDIYKAATLTAVVQYSPANQALAWLCEELTPAVALSLIDIYRSGALEIFTAALRKVVNAERLKDTVWIDTVVENYQTLIDSAH